MTPDEVLALERRAREHLEAFLASDGENDPLMYIDPRPVLWLCAEARRLARARVLVNEEMKSWHREATSFAAGCAYTLGKAAGWMAE